MVRKFIFLVLLLACTVGVAEAGWYRNPQFGYQIHFPDGWRLVENPANGGATATAPEQNIEIGVYALDVAGKGLTADSLGQLMATNIFGAYRLLGTQPDVINGMAGVTHMYGGMANGHQVVIGSFYLVQEPYGFILTSMMLASQAKPLAAKADAVFKTFARIGSAPPPVAAAPAPAPASPYDSSPYANMPSDPQAPAVPPAEPVIDPIDAPYVATTRARVRERPDVRSKTVEILKEGAEVHVLGRVRDSDWLLIARNDAPIGYTAERLLVDKAKAPPKPAKVAAPRVATAKLALDKLPKGVDFGRFFALVIGNTGYAHFPKLNTADDDAKAVAALLKDAYGYEVKVLLDGTRSQIIDAIEGMRGTLSPNDNLLIYYAGHGWLDTKAERGYWLPVDAKPDSKANWLSNATITDSIKAMDARHVMVVADSCYSGTLTRGIKIKSRDRDAERMADLAKKKARVVLTSGGLEPVSDSGGGEHSAFAKAFIDALASNDGAIDGTELFKRIERPVKLNADQTPAYSDMRKVGHEEGGDFVFLRRR